MIGLIYDFTEVLVLALTAVITAVSAVAGQDKQYLGIMGAVWMYPLRFVRTAHEK